MKRYRQKGFDLSPEDVGAASPQGQLGLYTSREPDGLWSAWVEDDAPPSPCDQTLKLFVGSSAFQAQIKAIRWMRGKTFDAPDLDSSQCVDDGARSREDQNGPP